MMVGWVSVGHPQARGVVRGLLHTGETEPWLTLQCCLQGKVETGQVLEGCGRDNPEGKLEEMAKTGVTNRSEE